MNISEIWEMDDNQLQLILVIKNQSLSDNRNFDRTVVAMILYNEGRLDAESVRLVELPVFNFMMAKTGNYKNEIYWLNQGYVGITLHHDFQ